MSNIDCSMAASNLAMILPVDHKNILLTDFVKGIWWSLRGTGQILWPNFDPFPPTTYRRTVMMDGIFFFS